MFRRRRPLLRAAVVGGGAYVAGKKVTQHSAQKADQEADQDERISDLEQQQGEGPAGQQGGAPAGQQAAGSAEQSLSDQLKQLTAMHGAGSLSDSEFAAAKRQLLGI
ncbi:MAG TPA: SHOCT domain-containing protein [Streptosporangiaceae bacterium]|nr:SHOCT domain-containing protein [Streptosporangiaceae bacterium]